MSQALSPRESINRHFNGHRPPMANRYYQLKAAKAQAVTEESRAAIQSQMEALAAEDEAIPKKNPHRKRVGLLMAADALTEATTRYREALARRADLRRNSRLVEFASGDLRGNRLLSDLTATNLLSIKGELLHWSIMLLFHQKAHDQGLPRIKMTFLDDPRHHQEVVIVRHAPKDRMVVRYLGGNPAKGEFVTTLHWDAATESYKGRYKYKAYTCQTPAEDDPASATSGVHASMKVHR